MNSKGAAFTQRDVDRVMRGILDLGDDVFIHASLGRLGRFEGDLDAFIRTIIDAVSDDGTVIMMTDTRSFAKTGRFSIDQPSETGLLTERFRQMEGVHRSYVPMVSCAAYGARAAEYSQRYDSHLDEDAPLTRLLRNDGKVMLLGVGYEKCTLFHLAEERHGSEYNAYKRFEGFLVRNGEPDQPISQTYFVRRDMSVRKDPAIAGDLLEREGKTTIRELGSGLVRVFRARDFDDCCMRALDSDPEAFIVAEQNS